MANHASAAKRHRQSLKRRARNRFAKATIRSKIRETMAVLEGENPSKEEAAKLAREATSLLDKAAIHGVLHKNTARRTIARLNQKVSS